MKPAPNFNRRIRRHCCYRLQKGRRAGQLCGEPIERYGLVSLNEDFCIDHALRREAKKQK